MFLEMNPCNLRLINSTFHLSKSPLPKQILLRRELDSQHFINHSDEDEFPIINQVILLVCYSIFESALYKITVVAKIFILRFFI